MAATRLTKLQKAVREEGLDGLLVTHLPHIQYLTNFSGSNGILIVPATKRPIFFTDFRYKSQVEEQVVGTRVIIADRGRSLWESISERGFLSDYDSLGFEKSHISFLDYDLLKHRYRTLKLVPRTEMVESLTSLKTEEEIANIRRAAEIGDKVFQKALEVLKPGIRELDLAAEIAYQTRALGGERDAFEIIVASGERSAMPHGAASDKKIKSGEMVTMDFGVVYQGFNSDMTRTVAVGKVAPELRKIYDIVLSAQESAIEGVRDGVTGRTVDAIARDFITLNGYGSKFGHSTGHGLGIEVHELPSVSERGERFILAPGMVVTVEPGIYVEGLGGVRIEDDVVVRPEGYDLLTRAPKAFLSV